MNINEDIYSPVVRNFIRFSKKTEKMDASKRLGILKDYCDNNFKVLGTGAFRTAYLSPNQEVIKIVNFTKLSPRFPDQPPAPDQNKLEIEKYNSFHSEIYPNIEAFDKKDYLWLIVEKVTPLSKDEWLYVKAFPKFANLISKFTSRFTAPAVHFAVDDMLNHYRNKFLKYNSSYQNETELITRLINYILPKPSIASSSPNRELYVPQEEHKELMEDLFSYLKSPDKNMARLRDAVRTGEDPADMHEGNLGLNDAGEIKIIDSGWETQNESKKQTYGQIFESFKSHLNEDIYSTEMRNFIRFSQKTEKYDDLKQRTRLLYQYMDAEGWKADCGAFRCVFHSPGGEIVKIIRPDGVPNYLEQNKREIEKFNLPNVEAFPRIEEVDPQNLWFVVEKVNILNPDTWDNLPRLFPQLSRIVPKGTHPQQLMFLLGRMMNFKDSENPKNPPMNFIRNLQADLMFSTGELSRDEFRKYYESIYDYMNNGDPNWKRLKYAIIKLNTRAFDLGFGNLGFDDDGVIKIIDAGM